MLVVSLAMAKEQPYKRLNYICKHEDESPTIKTERGNRKKKFSHVYAAVVRTNEL